MKTGFFDYFNRAKAEGLSDTEAYRWAITEDIYSADDQLLSPEQVTADGMCHHPQFSATGFIMRGNDNPFLSTSPVGCAVCGAVLEFRRLERAPWGWYHAPPVKIPTRSEKAAAMFVAMSVVAVKGERCEK